jgi:hypothetical protein
LPDSESGSDGTEEESNSLKTGTRLARETNPKAQCQWLSLASLQRLGRSARST